MKKRAFTLMELALIFFIMAILAVLFYRTLKPDKIVFNKLYYSAYTQMEDAYREVLAYSGTDNEGQIVTIYDNNGVFDITKYSTIFSKIINFIGVANDFSLASQEIDFLNYSESEGCYKIINDMNNIDFQATLSNNMQIRFDLINDCRNCPHQNDKFGSPLNTSILILTMDINGNTLPNQINKDIIQFEINKNGIFPIGDIETNTDLMKFNVLSAYNGEDNNDYPIQGENQNIATNLSYDVAACMANVPRHTYYSQDNKECGTIEVIDPQCIHNRLKCTIEAVKF